MKYVLDTDTMIYLLKGYENVVSQLTKKNANQIYTTFINHSELLYGAYNSTKKTQNLTKVQSFLDKISILPFCESASCVFAENKAMLKKNGNTVADLDLIIASITLKHDMTLVTNNTKHFTKIKKLKIENWHQ